jgi:hypothetical protein
MKTLVKKLVVLVIALCVLLPLGGHDALADCITPGTAGYSSVACVNQRLGFDAATLTNASALLIKRNPMSYVIVAFRIVLAVAVLITVFRIVLAGIKVSNSQDDADKRKEGLQTAMYALVGMVLALSALGLTFVVQKVFFGSTFSDQIVDCTNPQFVASATPAVQKRCASIQ